MKLRSLHIKGFKSFGNETTIHFNDEIIGIVGPNGSGKSNIVDAIRWVLGEQKSKELRLEKMVDVIFNGTKSKKKAGMAQVSLTFENSKNLIPLEYDFIKVSRILYDTNESEYRINDVTCRLKDIRDLFLDTGIGSNSYAIIELGMVDDILSDKDNARRKMFEQGAGISKYKTRKRETLLKLKNTQGDLDRIEDILFELQANLKKFEKQAKRTKKYYELKETYKELSIQKAVHSQKESITKEAGLKEKMNKLLELHTGHTRDIHTLEAEIEQIKKDSLDNEKMLTEQQRGFGDLIEGIRKLESDLAIGKQNKSFILQNLERIKKNEVEFQETRNLLNGELISKEEELKTLNLKSADFKSNFDNWKSKFEEIEQRRLAIQGENSSHLDQLKELEDNRFQLEKSIIEIKSQSDNFESNIQNILSDVSRLRSQYSNLSTSLTGTTKSLDSINENLDRLTKEKLEKEERSRILADEVTSKKETLMSAHRKIDAQNNELNLLEDMLNNMEGFPDSSKFLYQSWNTKKPILSDIIQCKEEYKSTLETYLQPYLDYFILDTIDEARESINLLKQAQKGKSNFFILESFEGLPNTHILFDHLGIPALSVISSDPRYQSLIHHLLANVVIVESEKVMAKDFPNEDVIYVSKDGESNRSRHIITGGSVGLFDGKRIGRKQAIKDLKSELSKLEKEATELESEISRLESELEATSIDDLLKNIQALSREKSEIEIQHAQLSTMGTNIEASITSLLQKSEQLTSGKAGNSNEIVKKEQSLQILLKEIENRKAVVSEQSGQIEGIAKDFGEVSSQFNRSQLEWVQHQNGQSTLSKEIDFKKSQIEELESKTFKASEEITNLNLKSSNSDSDLANIEHGLVEQYKIRDSKQEELGEIEKVFYSKRSVATDKESALKKLFKLSNDSQLSINNLKDELTGIEFELRSSMERLKIEFNIDIKTINKDEVLESITSIEEMLVTYEKIRKRLDNYGEINPMAVEAYDEILARWENMEAQKNDILEAKASLLDTIKEIDNDATEKFLEAFMKVKENFKEVFRSLFSEEDDCDLVLFDMEDPLNSGIEIIAKPKGKRPKVLNQLSGGEKTLTATALLFSLYLLKPAPFCIFDEVDAPLDDLNIQKFSKLIRRFSYASQFIIITHNKSTMANMDLLYGVYMQEQGISGITQVDFREYEHSEVFQTVNVN